MHFPLFHPQLFVATLTASIHRRHLMVWAVFGPRFLYEAGFQCLSDFLTLLVFLLLVRHSKPAHKLH